MRQIASFSHNYSLPTSNGGDKTNIIVMHYESYYIQGYSDSDVKVEVTKHYANGSVATTNSFTLPANVWTLIAEDNDNYKIAYVKITITETGGSWTIDYSVIGGIK